MVPSNSWRDRGGQLKIHSTISKKVRGAASDSPDRNQVQTVEEARRLSFLVDLFTEKTCPSYKNYFLLRKFRN